MQMKLICYLQICIINILLTNILLTSSHPNKISINILTECVMQFQEII